MVPRVYPPAAAGRLLHRGGKAAVYAAATGAADAWLDR
jgi:hypothetical protein